MSLPANRSWRKSASKSKTLSKQFTRTGILFVISAPSGAGKTTLCDALRQTRDFVYSVSCTTRLPRAGEIEGEDYHFLSEKDFAARVEASDFLEHANVHGRFYGTLRKPLIANLQNGVDVLIDVDIQGAAAIRAFDDPTIKDALKCCVDAAIAAGVFGSPFVIIDGEPFWGLDRFDQIERWLANGGF